MLFTPLALGGVALVAAGSATSLGTTITKTAIETNRLNKVKEILEKEQQAAIDYVDAGLKIYKIWEAANNGAAVVLNLQKAKQIKDVLAGFKLI